MAIPVGSLVNFIFKGMRVGEGQLKVKGAKAKLHGSPLPKGCYGVQVDKVWSEDSVPLHYPPPMDEDTVTLQQAIGTSIARPSKDVVSKAIH